MQKDSFSNNSKGEFQHRIFKFIILIIVFIFFCLILGFIYIEFFGPNSQENSPKNFYIINSKTYDILSSNDKTFYSKYDGKIQECDISKFYYQHITNNLPCIIKNKNKDSPESAISFVNKLIKFDQKIEGDSLKHDLNYPYLENYSKFIYVKGNNNFTFRVSPISQIKELKPMRNETSQFFNILYSQMNFYEKEENNPIILEGDIKDGEILYVPSYFFIQCKEKNWKKNLVIYQYKENNKLTNTIFKALFNDV